jgi:hypothetical protein
MLTECSQAKQDFGIIVKPEILIINQSIQTRIKNTKECQLSAIASIIQLAATIQTRFVETPVFVLFHITRDLYQKYSTLWDSNELYFFCFTHILITIAY